MKLKIGWNRYKIIEKRKPRIGNEIVDGYFHPLKNHIVIEKNYSKKQKQKILIHEVMHGILNNYGRLDDYENEELVDCMANGIMQIIYDNEKNIFEKVGE